MKKKPLYIYFLLSAASASIAHHGWMTLINNYTFSSFKFNGQDIGWLQSFREIPGLLAVSIVIPLMFLTEINLSLISLFLLGLGVFLSGYFSALWGLFFSTVVMSIGFHYFETLNKSLILQNTDKKETGYYLGKILSVGAFAALFTYGLVYFCSKWLGMNEKSLFYVLGGISIFIFCGCLYVKRYHVEEENFQTKKLFLKKKYTLFYLLNFFSGARRQIFVVFGGFLMVEKFNYKVSEIAALFLLNQVISYFMAPKIGALMHKVGEKKMLRAEYIGLLIIFLMYAYVDNYYLAGVLYLVDNMLFLMAIGINSYFKKIAEPHDISRSMSVAFTINHIMAVMIPVIYGYLWFFISYRYVFFSAAFFAFCSLCVTGFMKSSPQIEVN